MTITEIVAHVCISAATGIGIFMWAFVKGYQRGIESAENIWRSSLKHAGEAVASAYVDGAQNDNHVDVWDGDHVHSTDHRLYTREGR